MALINATAFKVQAANLATAIAAAWKDTGATKVADEIANPKHPLRQLEKLVIFNPETGECIADDNYIDAVYAGAHFAKGTRTIKSQTEPVLDNSVSSATVEDLTPTVINVDLGKPANYVENLVVSVDASAVPVAGFTFAGNIVNIQLRTAIAMGQVVVIETASFRMADLSYLDVTSQAVTNNVS